MGCFDKNKSKDKGIGCVVNGVGDDARNPASNSKRMNNESNTIIII